MSVYLAGDTIRLRGTFCKFPSTTNGAIEYGDPSNIKFKVFLALNKKQIGETINIDGSYKKSTGIYDIDYTIPSISNVNLPKTDYELVAEFTGILEGTDTRCATKFMVKWVI